MVARATAAVDYFGTAFAGQSNFHSVLICFELSICLTKAGSKSQIHFFDTCHIPGIKESFIPVNEASNKPKQRRQVPQLTPDWGQKGTLCIQC